MWGILTEISNPTCRASSLTSSRLNSIEGSFVVLFSQCQSKGPVYDDFSLDSSEGDEYKKIQTKIDPDTPRCQNPVNYPKIIDNIFGLVFSLPQKNDQIVKQTRTTEGSDMK